jgi:PIN domain nuclease of toxin-antitoxin system
VRTGWLVDSHALLWFLLGEDRLSPTAREVMEDPRAPVYVSTASLWEIAIKKSTGKFDPPDDLPDIAVAQGFEVLPVEALHAWAVRRLPLRDHRDPFDRMLAAQARVEMMPIISADERLDQYKIARLW